MKISLKLTQNVYFTIQKAFDNLFTEDDVRLNIIIKNLANKMYYLIK